MRTGLAPSLTGPGPASSRRAGVWLMALSGRAGVWPVGVCLGRPCPGARRPGRSWRIGRCRAGACRVGSPRVGSRRVMRGRVGSYPVGSCPPLPRDGALTGVLWCPAPGGVLWCPVPGVHRERCPACPLCRRPVPTSSRFSPNLSLAGTSPGQTLGKCNRGAGKDPTFSRCGTRHAIWCPPSPGEGTVICLYEFYKATNSVAGNNWLRGAATGFRVK